MLIIMQRPISGWKKSVPIQNVSIVRIDRRDHYERI
jgi:hypothetical protein